MEAFLKGAQIKKAVNSNTGETKKVANVPWVEKYRPKKIKDIAHQNEVISVLQKSLEGSDLPNLLFYGPPGTGKTSSILAAARELFGDLYKSRILELNASDERGIQVVRTKIKEFSQVAVHSTREDGRPCPPFKIVILDEADCMTNDAQSALRRIMEKQTKSTRFCLICNYITRIIEPLTSRCSKFRFKPLGDEVMKDRLSLIAEAEHLNIKDGCLDEILKISKGDLRKAITILQSTISLNRHREISSSDVQQISGVLPSQMIVEFMSICQKKHLEELDMFVEKMLQDGYPVIQLLYQLQEYVLHMDDISNMAMSLIMEKIAIADFRLVDGADEYLQLMDLAYSIFKIYNS